MKRFFTSLVLGVLLFPAFPRLAEASFTDLATTNRHYTAITSLVEQGVLEGYEDETFRPDQEVNRAEALKMFLMGMAVEVQTGAGSETGFNDVDAEEWYADLVGTALDEGIVGGYSDGSFKPGQSVNRAEAMKMLLLAAKINVSVPSERPFSDVGTEDWYAGYAEFAKTYNVVAPQTDGYWHGEEPLTRGEIAEMVYRLQVVNAQDSAYDESSTWARLDFPTVDITLKVPFEWGYKQEGVGAVFLLDSANGQVSLLTPYANGGTLLMTRYANNEGQSATELFAALVAKGDWASSQTTIGGYETLILEHDDGLFYKEWYIYLPNQTLVNLVALRGDGEYRSTMEGYLDAVVASLEYSSTGGSDQTMDEILADLREVIQVDGVGTDMMALLSDWELFETDSIGVGTGPVDYYYSPSANITIKYERSFDVILDIRDGKTSAF